MSLHDRVTEILDGSSSVSTALTSRWLTEGLKRLISLIPKRVLSRYTVRYSGVVNPYFYRIVNIYVDYIKARIIENYEEYIRALNPHSIDYIGEQERVAFLDGNTIRFFPEVTTEEVKVDAVQYYTVNSTQDSFLAQEIYLPSKFEEGSVLFAKLRLIDFQLANIINKAILEITKTFVQPSFSEIPSFNFEEIPAVLIDEISFGSLPPLPTFDIGSINQDISTTVSFNLTLPTLPNLEVVAGLIPDKTLELTTTITELDSLFNRINSSTNGYLEVYEDIELANAKLGVIQTKLQEIQTELRTELERLSTQTTLQMDAEKTSASLQLQASIENARNSLASYEVSLNALRLDLEKQLEARRLQLQTEAQRLESQIRKAVEKFSAELNAYKAALDKNSFEVQTTLKRLEDISIAANTVAFRNATEKVKAKIEEYNSKLNKFRTEIELYSTNVNSTVQKIYSISNMINVTNMTYIKFKEQLMNEYSTILQSILTEGM